MKVYGVTGWKNCGKTGLTERLVAEFRRRGLRVATIKHAHHNADVDHPGTDSYRHRAAGASQTILATPTRWALMTEGEEPPLEALLAQLTGNDITLIEGYKASPYPKVECLRAAAMKGLIAAENDTIRLIAADCPVPDAPVPVLGLDNTMGIADFIWRDLS